MYIKENPISKEDYDLWIERLKTHTIEINHWIRFKWDYKLIQSKDWVIIIPLCDFVVEFQESKYTLPSIKTIKAPSYFNDINNNKIY